MIKPVLQDDAFLADVRSAPSGPDVFHLWWLGQSGFLIKCSGKFILLDPYLSDSLTKKYANTDKPHVRMTERVIAPERLDFIDVVTSSHNHTDHLDAETLIPILNSRPKAPRLPVLIVAEANRAFAAERLRIDPGRALGLNANDEIEIGDSPDQGIVVRAVPAAHDLLERDEQGRCKYLGYMIHFGRWSIYHSGDTRWNDEIVNALLNWNVHHKIDVALLPINGASPERRVAGNLDSREAARLGRTIGAGVVIPCHYEMFEFNTASPDEFVAEAQAVGQRHCVLRCGQRFNSEELYAPEATFNSALAQYYSGKHILIGLTYRDENNQVTQQLELEGDIQRIDQSAIVIRRRDTGEELTLPPDLASIRPAPRGEYRLRSTSMVVKDPQLLTSWTVTAPGKP